MNADSCEWGVERGPPRIRLAFDATAHMTTFARKSRTPAEVFVVESSRAGSLSFREYVKPGDREAVRLITQSSGFFSAEEVEVAAELIDDRITRGECSDYEFIFADINGQTVGYACYGKIECTTVSYDLYWIAVGDDQRGHGVGRQLMAQVERQIAHAGGKRLYIDTASRAQYEPTRKFYERCGYIAEAVLKDFYSEGDSKLIMSKSLEQSGIACPANGKLSL